MSDSSKRPSLIDKLGSMKQSVRLRGLRKGLHHHSSDQHVQLEKDAPKEDDDCKVAESEDEAGDNFDNRTVAKVTHEVASQPKGFRWLQLKKTYFIDENGVDREWETAERVTRKSGIPDAVFIIAFLDRGRDEEELLLVSQFRPCVDSYVLEFPAGLVDEGETAEEAALRELREETGYIGSNPQATPIVPADAGMTNSMLQFVQVHVDMSLPENKRPKQELEETESIQTHYVPRSELREVINNPRLLRPGKKIVVDVR
eukprot:CAMPEP_0171569656 /NCGR_PEP_ID=MMETSP0961-20121227/2480_1 /TAXON_ID=87120 /ORGANISM="Aurantiochytrium limacinum, Strain ATCCMYA-1381" /LENGTH=257 /DNA_ID=CAMNT_0012123999 /DNA_START=75 /DNA_END=844 /DNA_ORIENTATION=-